MLIEAVSLGVPWTAQQHGTRIGYVQVHYELGGYALNRATAYRMRILTILSVILV